jgi:hypothetical protein
MRWIVLGLALVASGCSDGTARSDAMEAQETCAWMRDEGQRQACISMEASRLADQRRERAAAALMILGGGMSGVAAGLAVVVSLNPDRL